MKNIDKNKLINQIFYMVSSILTSIIFYYFIVIPTIVYPYNLLWLLLFFAIYFPFLGSYIALIILAFFAKKNRDIYKEFLKRMIPGIAGGLTIFIVTQFQINLPNSPNLFDTVIPSLLNSSMTVFFVIMIFIFIYVFIDRFDLSINKENICPFCKSTNISLRKTKFPKYKCRNCKKEFDEPKELTIFEN